VEKSGGDSKGTGTPGVGYGKFRRTIEGLRTKILVICDYTRQLRGRYMLIWDTDSQTLAPKQARYFTLTSRLASSEELKLLLTSSLALVSFPNTAQGPLPQRIKGSL
jgi:hypothetical protein